MLSLPFKMIKIDKGIVWAAFTNSRAKLALRATITMIKSLGMSVLAEGVETEDQKNWLEENGCDFLQGYYFSRPIPENEYIDFLENQIKENPEKYSDVLTYREEKLEEERQKVEKLKNDGLTAIKIDEENELIDFVEEI
jgi:predicted signal transduction protein with EAL and GGDEF domain